MIIGKRKFFKNGLPVDGRPSYGFIRSMTDEELINRGVWLSLSLVLLEAICFWFFAGYYLDL
jgi:hypothetical protein